MADKTYRGNGVRAKVTRLYDATLVRRGESVVQVDRPYWCLAIGREGHLTANRAEHCRTSCDAHEAAYDYITGRIMF